MAAKGGESKQGLIVTLIFFILATLTLGVFTYLGYDGQQQFIDARKKAEADLKKITDNRDAWKFQAST